MMERQVRAAWCGSIDDLLDVSRISRGNARAAPRARRRWPTIVLRRASRRAGRSLERRGARRCSVALAAGADRTSTPTDRGSRRCSATCSTTRASTPSPGGRIWLTVGARRRRGGRRAVKDSGIGIPAELLDGIFEMFTQVDRSLERSQTAARHRPHAGEAARRAARRQRSRRYSDGPGTRQRVRGAPAAGARRAGRGPPSRRRARCGAAPAPSCASSSSTTTATPPRASPRCSRMTGHETHTANDGAAAVEAAARLLPRRDPARHRHAAAERLRRVSADPRGSRAASDVADLRAHGLGPGRGPPQVGGGGLRRAPREARHPRSADAAARRSRG